MLQETRPGAVSKPMAGSEPLKALNPLLDAQTRGVDECIHLVRWQPRAGAKVDDEAFSLRGVGGRHVQAEQIEVRRREIPARPNPIAAFAATLEHDDLRDLVAH